MGDDGQKRYMQNIGFVTSETTMQRISINDNNKTKQGLINSFVLVGQTFDSSSVVEQYFQCESEPEEPTTLESFPKLKKQLIRSNTAPASSVLVERLFSVAGLIF